MSQNGIAWLPTKEERQIAKLDLAAQKRGESYDIDLLPTKYDGNDVIDNPNTGGLQPHRPWTAGSPPPPPPSGNDFGFTGDQNNWIVNGGFAFVSTFSDPAPTNPAYTYPDGSYTGRTYNFDGTSYMIGANLAIGGAWQSNTITIDFWFYPTANGVQLLTELGQAQLSADYHATLLEISSTGNIKARFWQNQAPGDLITSTNTVDLNKWNHIYFTEDELGNHSFELNSVPTTSNPSYTRLTPLTLNFTNIHYAVGGSDITNMGNTSGFQGKIGYLNIHDYPVGSTWTNTNARFRPPPTTPASLAFVIGLANYKEVAGTTSDWALSTTWTIEFWSNCAQASSGAPITIMSQAIGGGAIDIHYLSGNLTVNNDRVLCAEPTPGIWTHVALVCDGGNGLTVYYNGASVYTGSAYGLINNSATLVIGKRAQNNFQYFTGHLAGIRITNTAVYTGTFDPLAVALPPANITGTRLLINSTVGGAVVDASDSAHTLVNGSVTISEYYPPTIQLTSGSSLAFNGTDNHYVVVSGNQWNWNLGANWCMEWWQKIPVGVDGFFSILCQDANVGPYTGIDVFVNDGKIKLFNGNMLFYESPRAPRGRWNHIAVQKDGTTVKAFINGYRVDVLSTPGFSGNIVPSSPLNLVIGSRTSDGGANFFGQYFNGELSNIRISNTARYYTDTFTPPTNAQFDNYGVAVLVLDGPTYAMLDDVSYSNHTITNNGAVVTGIGPLSRSFGTSGISPQGQASFPIPVFPINVVGWTMTGPGITQTTTVTGQIDIQSNQSIISWSPDFTYSPGTYVFTPPP